MEKGFDSFLDYYYLLKYDEAAEEEWQHVMDALSVQETFFWREVDQIRTLVDVLARLREMDPRANVVIASADIQSTTHVLAKEAGAAGFIVKPFVAEAVLEKIAAALKGTSS